MEHPVGARPAMAFSSFLLRCCSQTLRGASQPRPLLETPLCLLSRNHVWRLLSLGGSIRRTRPQGEKLHPACSPERKLYFPAGKPSAAPAWSRPGCRGNRIPTRGACTGTGKMTRRGPAYYSPGNPHLLLPPLTRGWGVPQSNLSVPFDVAVPQGDGANLPRPSWAISRVSVPTGVWGLMAKRPVTLGCGTLGTLSVYGLSSGFFPLGPNLGGSPDLDLKAPGSTVLAALNTQQRGLEPPRSPAWEELTLRVNLPEGS